MLDQIMTQEWIHGFSNKQVVFTGKIEGYARKELQRMARDLGASSTPDDVSTSTKLLVRGESPTWKYGDYGEKEERAAKLQSMGHPIRIIDSNGFFGLMSGFPAPVIEPHAPESRATKLATEGGMLGAPYNSGQYSSPVLGDGMVFRDPDNVDRGLQAHGRTQDLLATKLRSWGLEPLAPFSRDCNFDIAWYSQAGFPWVAEIKSLTDDNETFQIRHALGQVLDYQHRLMQKEFHAKPCIALERVPGNFAQWKSLCSTHGVVLAIGPRFAVIDLEMRAERTHPTSGQTS